MIVWKARTLRELAEKIHEAILLVGPDVGWYGFDDGCVIITVGGYDEIAIQSSWYDQG
jgi:hypothetical protein